MTIIEQMSEIPSNFSEFVAEMQVEYTVIYGANAADAYRQLVEPQFRASLRTRNVLGLCALESGSIVAMALGQIKGDVGHIVFEHVLARACDPQIAPTLTRELVGALRLRGVRGIVMDCIPLCPLHIEETMIADGFRRVDRMLMACEVPPVSRINPSESVELKESERDAVGEILLRAFRGKPDPLQYSGLDSPDAVAQTLRQYRNDAYGRTVSNWARCIKVNNEIVGVALGSEIAEDTGFIFQVGVDPVEQNGGYGTMLVRELLQEFARAGMNRAMLGVTVSDGAYRLYQRLDFADVRGVKVYIWTA